jgi:DNA/RNA-binding domain of Phe-tRNA-synthetase-like protein
MISISITDAWNRTFPGAKLAILELSNVENIADSTKLNELKGETEKYLRNKYANYSRKEFLSNKVMAAYDAYYKSFKKTYHVLLQVESIVLKGKALPDISPLVDSNFIAEVETFILTAGHDVSKLVGALLLDVSKEEDFIIQKEGEPRAIYANDMVMRDSIGISCSIIYGQDNKSLISRDTTDALYVSYVPKGVPDEAVEAQLSKIEYNVRQFSPNIYVEQRKIYKA